LVDLGQQPRPCRRRLPSGEVGLGTILEERLPRRGGCCESCCSHSWGARRTSQGFDEVHCGAIPVDGEPEPFALQARQQLERPVRGLRYPMDVQKSEAAVERNRAQAALFEDVGERPEGIAVQQPQIVRDCL
jgi:hypothetical protein